MNVKAGLLTMIAGECANHRNGACLGMDIRVDKATGEVSYPRLELPKCLVAMRLPCRYFERCLMPLCAKRQEYAGAGNEYATRTGRPVKTVIDGLEDEDLRALLMRQPFVGHSQTLAHMDRNETILARKAFEKALEINSDYGWVKYVLMPKVTSEAESQCPK